MKTIDMDKAKKLTEKLIADVKEYLPAMCFGDAVRITRLNADIDDPRSDAFAVMSATLLAWYDRHQRKKI